MKKAFKIFGIFFGVTAALLLVGITFILLTVDPNEHKSKIEALVQEQTGRTFQISGELNLSFFPWVGVKVGAMSLGNAPGFGEQAFVAIQNAEVHVEVMPLLQQEIKVSTITLNGLALNLAKNAEGKDNWSDIGQSSDDPTTDTISPSDDEPTQSSSALTAVSLGGLHISNANIHYVDASTNAEHRIQNLSLSTGPLTLGQAFDLTLELVVSSNQPQIESHIQLVSRINADIAQQRFELSNVQLDILTTGEGLPSQGAKLSATTDITLDLAAQTLDMPRLALNIADQLHATLSAKGSNIIDTPEFNGALDIAQFNPKQLLTTFGQPEPDTHHKPALTAASLALSFAATPDSAQLKDMTMKLDESTVTSTLGVKNFAQPALDFQLHIDRFNVDNYLPTPTESESSTDTTPTSSSEPLDLTPLRELNLKGQINIDHLVASNLKVNDIAVTINAKDGLINIHPLKANLYDGKYNGNVRLNAQGDTLKTSLDETLNGIQAGPLLQDFMENDLIEGQGDVSIKLTALGSDGDSIMQSADGLVKLAFTDGAINGYNIGQILRDAKARLKGEKLSSDEEIKTDFAEMSASFQLKDGVAKNNDLSVKSPLLRASGEGEVFYVKQALDYVATVTIVGTSKGQGGKELDDLKGLPLDIHIKGPFTEPDIDVDLAKALKEQAKAKLDAKKEAAKQKLDAEKERAKDKLEDELKDKFKKLF